MLGAEQLVHFEVDATPVVSDEILEVASDTDPTVRLAVAPQAQQGRVPLLARISADVQVHVGDPILIALPLDHLHFFDLRTGMSQR